MAELIDLSWRAYPAGLLIAIGLGGAVWSAYRGVVRARALLDPPRALAIMQAFRIGIVGLAVAAIGAAWWWQIGWLFVLALVIGGEELLESTIVITALKHGPLWRAGACSRPRWARPPARRPVLPPPQSGGKPPHPKVQLAAAASQRAMVVSRSGGSGMA